MFKHFIGKIYLLAPPPREDSTQLEIPFPDTILGDLDEVKYKESLTKEQVAKIVEFEKEMSLLLGKEAYDRLLKENIFQHGNSDFIKNLAYAMHNNPNDWNGLAYLNSDNCNQWDRLLYKIIALHPGGWEAKYGQVVAFIKAISKNWTHSIPDLLDELEQHDIGIDLFFKLERIVAFKFAAVLSDVNELQKEIINKGIDVSPFVTKLSHVFLPSVVYQLEEYGLPRMISKKLHHSRVLNFLDANLDLHTAIQKFQQIGLGTILAIPTLDEFDKYIVRYFFEGITLERDLDEEAAA